jgi:hypothetical protein
MLKLILTGVGGAAVGGLATGLIVNHYKNKNAPTEDEKQVLDAYRSIKAVLKMVGNNPDLLKIVEKFGIGNLNDMKPEDLENLKAQLFSFLGMMGEEEEVVEEPKAA